MYTTSTLSKHERTRESRQGEPIILENQPRPTGDEMN